MANERVWSLATIEEFWSKVKNLVSGYKIKQTEVSDPSASGTGVTFIDSISQNANGVIAPTKKTVRTMGGASASAAGSAGLVPAPAAGNHGKFLRGDGSWANTPYPGTMTGATASTAGSAGLVPAPSAGNQDKFLMGNGTWGDGLSPNNVANNLTTTTAGKVLDARQGKVLKDDISDLSTKQASVESGLAYRETGATASRNISDGEYVFWNGVMYRADGDIALGETLEEGENLTAEENALSALDSKGDEVLLVPMTTPSQGGQKTVQNLNDFRFLRVELYTNNLGLLNSSATVAISRFKTDFNSGNNVITIGMTNGGIGNSSVYYVNDTTISAGTSNTVDEGVGVKVYGIY